MKIVKKLILILVAFPVAFIILFSLALYDLVINTAEFVKEIWNRE